MVRFADNVFVGRVSEKIDFRSASQNVPPIPSNIFAMEVEENIKGSFSGTVEVEQEGGCVPSRGHIMLVNDDRLLKPGETVVFSTVKQPDGPHRIVGANYGDIRVETEKEARQVVTRLEETEAQLSRQKSSRERDS